MELDAQVEEPPHVSATEQKHKHKKKDKHKHKHHKKSKRDRHGGSEQNPVPGLQVEGEVARTGSEDGELPGSPVVEASTTAPVELEVTDAKEPADSLPAGPEHSKVISADQLGAKRR